MQPMDAYGRALCVRPVWLLDDTVIGQSVGISRPSALGILHPCIDERRLERQWLRHKRQTAGLEARDQPCLEATCKQLPSSRQTQFKAV